MSAYFQFLFIMRASKKSMYLTFLIKQQQKCCLKATTYYLVTLRKKRENDCEIKSAANTKILVLNNNKNLA